MSINLAQFNQPVFSGLLSGRREKRDKSATDNGDAAIAIQKARLTELEELRVLMTKPNLTPAEESRLRIMSEFYGVRDVGYLTQQIAEERRGLN